MFSKLALLATVSFALSTFALPGGPSSDSCSTGSLQCCDRVEQANHEDATALLGLVGATVQDVTVAVGLQCNPISVIGVASGNNW